MTPELTINKALVFREHLARWGVDLPMWNSEGSASWNFRNEPLPSPEEARGAVARGYILNWAYGHENFMWYNWGPVGECDGVPLVESDWETLSPAGEAYRKIAEWLIGARMTNSEIDENGNYIVAIDNPADMFRGYIVWRTSGSDSFTPDPEWGIGQWTTLTGMDNPYNGTPVSVGIEPIMFVAQNYLIPEQWYSIQNQGYGHTILQALGAGQSNNVITASATTGGDWVRWRFIPAPGGSYYIENYEGRLQAIISNGSYNVRTTSSAVSGRSVRWRLVPHDENGSFYLENVWLNRHLRVNLSTDAYPRFNVHTTSNGVTGRWVHWQFVPQF
jgi:hypothetical protein